MTAALQADGMVSYFNYVDAEYDLYSSQLGYVQLMAEQLSAYVSLYKALGGGWTEQSVPEGEQVAATE